jgi:hypothetical protein
MPAMLRHWAIAIAVLGAMLVVPAAASAAIEVGDDCIANEAEGGLSMLALKRGAPGPLPLTTPMDGVATGWRVRSNIGYDVVEAMQVSRSTGVANQLLIVGESRPETIVTQGNNAFATRIPVKAGDHFGATYSIVDIARCSATGDPGDEVAAFEGGGVGGTVTYITGTQIRIPLVVSIEPDKDGDGYGDETQDKCPQMAAAQGPCPLVALDSLVSALKGSVSVLVATDTSAPVTVTGSVKLGAKKPKGKARSSASLELKAGTQTVAPPKIARFTLRLPPILKSQLRALPPSKSLKLRVSASAGNAAGQTTADVSTVKLKGQKHPGGKH